jgi:serine/threonine protein kinase/tetratricopeptide (TPR) repeat protein
MSGSQQPHSASDSTVIGGPVAEQVGALVGPYRLLEQIGEGGFGLVFVAEQQKPVKRRVALKLIKPGMDTRDVIARFEAERQALALMDHPNIARVLDAGATDSGRPYFVMELVHGIPITDYCDRNLLTPRERLELFVSVCQAVQHAHQKGIIHRDLKPSNVLVTAQDGKPVVKVIDFGVAKALHQQLTDKTIYTRFAQMVGTPLYMSPEQAEMTGLDIDTRSDIYSLGVLLYELLTGTTPFDKKRVAKAAYDELIRMIREEDPPKPSTRLSQATQSLPAIAAQRKTEPARLSKMFRGDLDWITMKALEKDRTRRYESASGLAADVLRYLHDEPVTACPPSSGYRLRKFARKHRTGLAMAAIAALLLLAGLVSSTWQAIRATRAEEATRQALAAEAEQRRLAEQREAEARAVLNFVDQRVFAAARPEGLGGGLGREVTLRKAVESAVPYLAASFRDQPLVEARLRTTLGTSLLYLGEAKLAAEHLEIARELYAKGLGPDHPDTLSSMNSLAESYADLGRNADALKLREETLALCKARLGPDHRETLASMEGLASSYADVGRHTDALRLREETLALQKAKRGVDDPDTLHSMIYLAISYTDVGRNADALKLCEEALALQKARLGPDHPDTLTSMDNLATSYATLGRHADALKLREETLALRKGKLGPEHPKTLRSMTTLAVSYALAGRHQDALRLLEERQSLQARRGPELPDSLYDIACVHATIAKSGDHAAEAGVAMEWLKRAVASGWKNAQLMKTDPDLAALRNRDDFKQLIADLEAENAKKK